MPKKTTKRIRAPKIEQIDSRAYHALSNDLKVLLVKWKLESNRAAQELLTTTYWKMGKRLAQERALENQQGASQVIDRLANDLEMNRSLLYRILKFYHLYPQGLPSNPPAKDLGWTGHVALLPIASREKRLRYMKEAIKQQWSTDDLRTAVKEEILEDKPMLRIAANLDKTIRQSP